MTQLDLELDEPKTQQEMVYRVLLKNKGIYFTSWEIANLLKSENVFMSDESCARYLRFLRMEGQICSQIRYIENRKGKPYTEYFLK